MIDKSMSIRKLLEPRSIAVVGASARAGSFGERMAMEVLRSPGGPRVSLIHPKYQEVQGQPCVPSLLDLPEPVDLVMLGVPDEALVDQFAHVVARGDGAAIVFGGAHTVGADVAARASVAGMAMCGAGSMGFVNPARGIRAIGYVERFPLDPGPVALVTHSGSVFSALLRTHRRLDFSLAVSSGQELVTTTADYLAYALELEQTRVIGLFAETLRDADALRASLAAAAALDVPVVALTVGGSPTGRTMVTAHSGAVAGDDAAWEALFSAYGVHRVRNLDEMVDTFELFAIGRRVRPATASGIATVHDSGGERALVADIADQVGVPFAALSATTRERLSAMLDPGLEPTNPLDVWGRGADTEGLFRDCMTALADDESVALVVAALDLVEEYDGDESYPLAIEAVLELTSKPVAVLSNVAAGIDQEQAARLRAAGVPVLEGTASGLLALRHLLDHALIGPPRTTGAVNADRSERWRTWLASPDADATAAFDVLSDYGISSVQTRRADSSSEAIEAAESLGFPVVLKTAEPGVDHKSDVAGVITGLADAAAVAAAYDDVSQRLGGRVVVQHQVVAGVELALGVVHDPLLGPLVVVATGGSLVEVLEQRQVALPPLSEALAEELLDRLPVVSTLLGGVRGQPPANRAAVVQAIVAVSQLALELGDSLAALDVNPLICGPDGAVAVDALFVPFPAP